MPINILLPALSPTMTKGNLVKWYKKEGDEITSGEVIFDVETDKATMEVDAGSDGILGKILVPEESKDIPVGSVVAVLLEEGEKYSEDKINGGAIDTHFPSVQEELSSPPVIENQTHFAVQAPSCVVQTNPLKEENGKTFISPLAKRIAFQNNIDLKKLQGSGPGSRIVKSDVLQFISNAKNQISVIKQAEPFLAKDSFTLFPHSAMRIAIASRLLESKQTIPHFYLNIEARVDKLMDLREAINKQSSTKISINDFITKACAMSLKALPKANSSWTDEGIKQYNDVDISVAVSIDQGLITPIVKSADKKSLSNVSSEIKLLVAKAKESKLKPEEFQGGNFTISNLGMFGIKHFAAIINPPQSCILAVGALTQKPIIEAGQVVPAYVIELTLSCDHRVVDGVLGAELLKLLKNYLEEPLCILL